MPISAGTYINAFPVIIETRQPVTRIALPQARIRRRELERQHGTPLFLSDGFAWTAASVAGQPQVDITPQDHRGVHLFNLREALRLQAEQRGWDFWIQQGEMSAVQPGVKEMVGPFAIQSALKARAVWEGLQTAELMLVASSGVRWLVDLPLSDSAVQSVAVGEYVMRRPEVANGQRRGRVDGFAQGQVLLADRAGGTPLAVRAADYQLVARPALVHRLILAQGGTYSDASRIYSQLLAASGTLRREDNRSPNQYAVKDRFTETEKLLDAFGRQLTLANGTRATIDEAPHEIYPRTGPAREPWTATTMQEPRLRFDAAIPSRLDTRAYQGLRLYGAYDLHELKDAPRILLAYPSAGHQAAESFGEKLISGSGSYPGFARMFGMPADRTPDVEHLRLPSGQDPLSVQRLREALTWWAATDREWEPDLALVVVPHTDRWITDTPYYVAKEFFARRAIPSQMVTEELLHDTGRLGWSLANIALAGFAKLGGIPWVVDARGHDTDLCIGVGRADINDGAGGRRQTFGYAVAFVSNGSYLATHSRPPAADETDYEQRLTSAVADALQESRSADLNPQRVIIHLARRTGEREIRATQRALAQAKMEDLPVAFLRIDDSSLFEFLDGSDNRYAPPKGLTLRLGERRALLQVESLTSFGPARRPLLIELDERSTVSNDDFGSLVLQIFRLGHANWRGFNARSKPVTLFYGERLAELVGYMNQRGDWDPATMDARLRRRPWFL